VCLEEDTFRFVNVYDLEKSVPIPENSGQCVLGNLQLELPWMDRDVSEAMVIYEGGLFTIVDHLYTWGTLSWLPRLFPPETRPGVSTFSMHFGDWCIYQSSDRLHENPRCLYLRERDFSPLEKKGIVRISVVRYNQINETRK